MPSIDTRVPQFKPRRSINLDWGDFSGGWNNIFRPTELKPTELAEATNLMLTGKGVPTGRWGTGDYFLAGSNYVRSLGAYINTSTDTNELLAITDSGLLTKRSGASYSIITGASFASGYDSEMVQLGNNMYIVGGNRELTKYTGTALQNYPTISKPTGLGASNFSGASGGTIYSWRITALSQVGETLGSEAVQLSNLPFDLTSTLIYLNWNAVSTASGVLRGYQLYRGTAGDESYIASVDKNTTEFWDNGYPQSDTLLLPTSDTTGGPNAKYILKFDDRLVFAGIDGDDSLVFISGRYPYQDRLHWSYGGTYVRVAPDDGESIKGLGIAGSNVKGGSVPASILVFKGNSTYAVVLKSVTLGNYALTDAQFQKLAPVGCVNNKTVAQVENDTFFLDRKGIYSIGSEPNFLNEIRSKELSSRIRTYMRGLTQTDYDEASAGYMDSKYILSFASKRETVIYDYERRCFMGPWKTPWGVTRWLRYFDSTGNEKYLAGADNGYVKEFSPSYNTDSGTVISKTLRTRKEDFGDWSVMKVIKMFNILFRNVKGTVNVNIRLEDRNGVTITTKGFNITGSTGVGGWGTDQWGDVQTGLTNNAIAIEGEEILRWTQLYKTARVMQVEITTTTGSSNFEFLGIRATAQPMTSGGLNPATRV
jgi:hypothetical protein